MLNSDLAVKPIALRQQVKSKELKIVTVLKCDKNRFWWPLKKSMFTDWRRQLYVRVVLLMPEVPPQSERVHQAHVPLLHPYKRLVAGKPNRPLTEKLAQLTEFLL